MCNLFVDSSYCAVTKANRYEAIINEEFSRFAEHFGVIVLPIRVRKPKDKSHVENAVKLTYKDIFTQVEKLHGAMILDLSCLQRIHHTLQFIDEPGHMISIAHSVVYLDR